MLPRLGYASLTQPTFTEATRVSIKEITAKNIDFTRADEAMREKLGDPNWQRPEQYTWHHGPEGSNELVLVKEDLHGRVAHKGSGAKPRSAARLGKALTAFGVAFDIYFTLRDAMVFADAGHPDQVIHGEFYFSDGNGSVFVVQVLPPDMAGHTTRYVMRFVSGVREGDSEMITKVQAVELRKLADAYYGKVSVNFWREATFEEGIYRKSIPIYGIDIITGPQYEIGYLDRHGEHYYQRWQWKIET